MGYGSPMTATKTVETSKDNAPILIQAKDVERLTSCSRWTIYRLQREGRFPKAINTGAGPRAPRLFVDSEVRQWISDRISERG